MEFLLIGESKIKIVMTERDIKEYKIDVETPDCAAHSCRRAIWRILDRAKEETGFDPTGDKILVQFYPTNSRECEVFVTKLGVLSCSTAKIVSRSDRITMLSREQKLYSFDGVEALMLAALAIKRSLRFCPPSDVYRGYGDRYFLSVEEYGKGGETFEFPQILEFGKSLSADFSLYLTEHATLIAKGDGLERFSGNLI